ncbi:MAG: zf-HC2 domain-containing protein [Desulfotomaculaceae bacterium]|nr:zf-HC2 domain-containing protein [Desulfotomaculaceae bacterium]MDD4766752.1 zf-HC2 domain-containing protein [Desulfotomaculaceae bacterium]
MSCDNTILMLNDFLDETLSKNEERQVKRHLKECASCRSEYHNLENADNTLRQVICEMVADIDVPRYLSERIEKSILDEKRNTLPSRLATLLKTPAVAAALLFVVLAAGFLIYSSNFNPVNQQQVAISDQDNKQYTDSAVDSVELPPTTDKIAAGDNNEGILGALNEVQILDSDAVRNPEDQKRIEPENTVKESVQEQPGSMARISRDRSPAPADDTAPEGLDEPRPAEEQKTALVTSAPPGMGVGMATPYDGTLEATPRHGDFIPAKPVYLPQGSVLENVTWLADEVSQDYRTGSNYFTVSQSRLKADDFAFIEKLSQVSNVNINGWQGFIKESRPEPGDHVSGTVTTLRWWQDEWAFSVSGDLPAEEIIKISTSLK